MKRIVCPGIALALALAACGGGQPAKEPENTEEGADDTKRPAKDDDTGPSGTATIKDDSKKKAVPCGGFDIPDLLAVLSQTECEVADAKPDEKPLDVKDLLEIKVVPESPKITPGAKAGVTVTFHNKSKADLPLEFVVDPEPRFDFELYTPAGDRADKPAGDEPSLPSGAGGEAPEHHIARVTLAQQGTARISLKWDAVKYKWAPAEKAKGALPGHGYPREPAGPLKKGKYILRVITPLVGVFEGVDHEVSQPRTPIEIGKLRRVPLRALFFGSPSFAVPSLEALHAIADVAGVVCQPDKPAGRGLTLTPPAVKVRAIELGLACVQPTKLRTGEFGRWVRDQRVDVALVVAYGRILPGDVLAGPRLGCVNVHASLLPKYRGAAPITWAVVRGEAETGITLMKLDEGMDTGPTFARVTTPIGPEETAGELGERLARLGADAVREWLPRYVAGDCRLDAQDGAQASAAPMLEKAHGRIDWSRPARAVHDHVRGMSPWPGAFTTARGRTLKVRATRVLAMAAPKGRPGEVVLADKSRVLVACARDAVELVTVQPEGKKAVRGGDWAIGRGVAEGDVLGADA